MEDFAIRNITAGHYFTEPLYLDDGFILTVPETPVGQRLLKLLSKWEYVSVKTSGTQQDFYTSDDKAKRKVAASLVNDGTKLAAADAFFNGFLSYTMNLFAKAAHNGKLPYYEIAERVREVVKELKVNRRYLLQIQQEVKPPVAGYLGSHAVRSTILSIVVGMQLKLPSHRLIELGIAAFVHEIGMVKIPSHIQESTGDLSAKDKEILFRHPVLGYELLKENNFPMGISIVAMEHHERENGTGYPRRLSSKQINLYSKIVAVVCSFEAITANRPYKDARDGFNGILDLLKNPGQAYDDSVIKALIQALSVFPIGTFVLLSNNQKAQVIDTNQLSPRYPIVQIVDVTGADGKNPVVETSPDGLYVVRSLTRDELA
ncbi:MAG: HD-GYP domain-containing protein [Spirochaetaceae bacterium]|nr:HD-GYP domain-containing protein [Spirochaetaceae bacterium]